MRNKLFTVLGGVLAFSAIAFVLLAFAQVREVSSSVSHPTPTVARTKQQTPVHVKSISITPIPPAPGVLPASAIQKYILTHGFEGGPTMTGNPPTILTLALVTSKEAATIMGGEQTGLPDDAQVYYILLRGPFVLDYMSLPRGRFPPSIGHPCARLFERDLSRCTIKWLAISVAERRLSPLFAPFGHCFGHPLERRSSN